MEQTALYNSVAAQPVPIWPQKELDRLAMRMIERAIADAVSAAMRGQIESKHLSWLWETGRKWAEIFGGVSYKQVISNICEEIEIMAYEAKEGRTYSPTGQLGPLLKKRRRGKKPGLN